MSGLMSGSRVFNFNGSINVKEYKNKIEGVATFYNNVLIISFI